MFYRGYCPRGNACYFIHPPKCGNNQKNNVNNNNISHYQHYQQNSNAQNNWNSNNQITNNSNGNFLGPWPTLGNGATQMQPMMQMMQNMMDRMTRMDNKLMHLEMGRQIYG